MKNKRGRPKGSKNKNKVIEQKNTELNLARAKSKFVCGMFAAFPVMSSFFLLYTVALEISDDIKEIKKEVTNEKNISSN